MVDPELDIIAKIGKLAILDQVLIFLGWLLQIVGQISYYHI